MPITGARRSACNTLEKAFAAAFQAYFVGDPCFIVSNDVSTGATSSIFVAAQSVQRLLYPQVCFMCIEAEEQVARSNIYMATLHMIIDTALSERPDDYDSLLALHQERVDKCLNLRDSISLLQSLINQPASPPPNADQLAVPSMNLMGLGKILRENNAKEANRLCFVCSFEVGFQPI
jgi:hypothetical protein